MKLLNILSIAAFGTLIAAGCSASSVTTTDGGTDGATGTDTGVKTDTGAKTDSGTTPTDTGGTIKCSECQMVYCKAQEDACKTDDATLKGCNDLITCVNGCVTLDAGTAEKEACANSCVSDSMSTPGKALIGCLNECFGKCEM